MSVYIQKNLSSKKAIVLGDITDYKIQHLNDQAYFHAFLLKSNCLMIYIQIIKVRYQRQLILKITEYSDPTDQEQLGALILKWSGSLYNWHFSINAKQGLSGSKNDWQHAFYLLASFFLCCQLRVTFLLFTPQQYKVKNTESICKHLKLKLVMLSLRTLKIRIM